MRGLFGTPHEFSRKYHVEMDYNALDAKVWQTFNMNHENSWKGFRSSLDLSF